MSISANFKKILRDYNYLYESLTDVKEISSIAEGEFRQAMIDSGDKEALQALVPNESQQTKLNEIKQEEQEKEPTHNDVDFKKLFRKIVIKCHPDKNTTHQDAATKFIRCQDYYDNHFLIGILYIFYIYKIKPPYPLNSSTPIVPEDDCSILLDRIICEIRVIQDKLAQLNSPLPEDTPDNEENTKCV